MTTMKEIKEMSDKEIAEFVQEKRESVRSLRFGAATRNTREVRTSKKEISRALTELTVRSKKVAK